MIFLSMCKKVDFVLFQFNDLVRYSMKSIKNMLNF